MSTTGTDPQNSELAYSWEFDDGGSATGKNVVHKYAAEGRFRPRVTAVNRFGLGASSTTTQEIVIAYLPVPTFEIFDTNFGHFLGQTFVAETTQSATDSNGLSITYLWSFGDSTTANTPRASHVYATPGTYPLTLTVSNSANHSSTSQAVVRVFAPISGPALVDNVFAPYCSGPFCAAVDAVTYSGAGVGIWRYHNTSTSSAILDIAIAGVRGGQTASLVFVNGSATNSPALPYAGTLVAATPVMSQLRAEDELQDVHALMLQRNLDAARDLVNNARPTPLATPATPRFHVLGVTQPPALGTTRVWNETFGAVTPYTMEVAATCALPANRNAVFWLDSAKIAAGVLNRARIRVLVDGFCGAQGVYARETALSGDVWGSAAAAKGLIEDTAGAYQNLHIVFPAVPGDTSWGGYFSALNLVPPAIQAASNGQLAIFINGNLLTRDMDDSAASGTLIHELKHHINYYQRTVARNSYHPVWLEETSAMLAEDLFSLPAFGFNRAESRHSGYVFSGGNIGYLNWNSSGYNLGGSFGAFLHRKYGLAVDRRLIDSCVDNGSPASGYQCLDSIIASLGGHGFADEFARHGASVFGGLGRGNFPSGFGFPSVEKDGLFLQAFSSTALRVPSLTVPARPVSSYLAAMHTYQIDFLAAGQSTYRRNGVVVPAGTTLVLLIQ